MPDRLIFLRKRVVAGAPLFCCGILFMTVSLTVYFIAQHEIDSNVRSKLVSPLDDPQQSPSWADWLTNYYQSAPPLYTDFYVWNLTNVNDVVSAGATPVYELAGPYSYRKYFTKLNVTFFDSKDKMSFTEYIRYYFDEDRSQGHSPNDTITNLNIAYYKLVQYVGSEEELLFLSMAPVLQSFVVLLTGPYTQNIIDRQLPPYLESTQHSLTQEILSVNQNGTTNATSTFYTIWANATEDPTAYPDFNSTMRVSNSTYSSGISIDSCVYLWSSDIQYSLTNPNQESVELWYLAELGSTNALVTLQLFFGLSPQQMELIINWRSRVKTLYNQAMAQPFGLNDTSQIGYEQWGMGDVTVPLSEYFPLLNLQESPEFAIWAEANDYPERFTASEAYSVLSGPYGLTNPTNMDTFYTEYNAGNITGLAETYGVTEDQISRLDQYLNEVIRGVYCEKVFDQAFSSGKGLFATTTVDEYLWGGQDPLLDYLDPNHYDWSLYENDTSEGQALSSKIASTFYSGNDHLSDTGEYITWEGRDEVYTWKSPVDVSGQWRYQMRPGKAGTDNFKVWSDPYQRTVTANYDGRVTKHGIPLRRYELDWQELTKVNSKYFNNIAGLVNLTAPYGGIPVFTSLPQMYGVDSHWANTVIGMEKVSYDDVRSYFDVEKYTGIVLEGHSRQQINFLLDNTTTYFNIWNVNVTLGVLYPLSYSDENKQFTDSEANWYEDNIYYIADVTDIIFIVGLVFGSLLFTAGAVFFFLQWRQNQKMKRYQLIQ